MKSSGFTRSGSQRLGKAVIVPVLAHVGLLITFDLARHLVLALSWIGLGFAGVWIARRLWRGIDRGRLHWPILGVAALLRVLVLPLPPTLSDDIFRYIWDGRVLTAGFNPYAKPPESQELMALRDELWKDVAHREVATVYPPLAQGVFMVAASLPAPILTLKSILALLDLGTCALLLLLARYWNLPVERTVWYAWNPLVTLEIAGMGHIDALGVTLVVLVTTLLALPRRRWLSAALAAAGAILAKLVPVLAIPVWARQSGRGWRFALISLALASAALLPVCWSTAGPPPGLVEYGVSWEFNGPLFEPLWRLVARLELPVQVERTLHWLKVATPWPALWDRFYHYNYPQFLAKVLLSWGLLVALIGVWRTPDTPTALRRVFGSVIVFSATVYPWYALWVVPWAALSEQRAWLWLSGLLFLSYLPQFFEIPLFPWIHALIWLPFAFLLSWTARVSTP